MLLGGPAPTCWPLEGMWVLCGAEVRPIAEGLLWAWGIGRALCTGLGLGSPDFIFDATRMAGIFSRTTWPPRALPPPSHTQLEMTCYKSARLLVNSHMVQLLLWRCYQIEGTHVQFAPDLVEVLCVICPGLCCSCWISAGGWAELPNVQWGALNPLVPPVSWNQVASAHHFLFKIPNLPQTVLSKKLWRDGNDEFHSAKSRRKNLESHLEDSPVAWWQSECSLTFISRSEWESAIGKKDPTGCTAAPLPQSPLNYTIASGWR